LIALIYKWEPSGRDISEWKAERRRLQAEIEQLEAELRNLTGEHRKWNTVTREVERLCHLAAGVAFHNALEDRIAQLAHAAANTNPTKVYFRTTFDENAARL
jgi:hypothetical protein